MQLRDKTCGQSRSQHMHSHKSVTAHVLDHLGFIALVFLVLGQLCAPHAQCEDNTLSVDLKRFGMIAPDTVEFSVDGKYIAVWRSSQGTLDPDLDVGKLVVFDRDGHELPDTVETNGTLRKEIRKLFPKLGWRGHFNEFVASAAAWGFTAAYDHGVRLMNRRPGHGDGTFVWDAELWTLEPNRKVWSRQLPESAGRPCFVCFWGEDDDARILVAFCGTQAVVLNRADGRVVKTLNYRDRFPDASRLFWPHTFALDSTMGILACGDHEGRRVRVIAVETQPAARELQSSDLHKGDCGIWRVGPMEFAAGRLLVQFGCTGRGVGPAQHAIRLYSSKDWSVIWEIAREGPDAIRCIAMSPDGLTLAICSGSRLELVRVASGSK